MARGMMAALILLVAVLLSAVAVEGLFAAPQQPGSAALSIMVAGRQLHTREVEAGRDIDRVISVLESRIGSRQLPLRAKERLASMDSRDFRLIVKLCDRIDGGGNTSGTDLAFLLAAALIVLS